MRNHRVPARPLRSLLTVVALLALAACGGNGEQEEEAGSGGTTSASASGSASAEESPIASAATEPGVPAGTTLTPEGTTLRLGRPATVAYEPRPGETAVLDLTVTRLFRTTWRQSFEGWKITRQQRSAQPYFVEGTAANAGETDLGGRPVPLLAVGSGNVLVEATPFATRFAPCRPSTFPRTFAGGDTMTFCLVYLVPERGDLRGVGFQPTDDVEAITWTGKVRPLPRRR